MISDKSILYFNFVQMPNEYADEMIHITAQFIARLMKTRSVAIFQSAFGFMNNDIPFTMIVKASETKNNTYHVWLEVNDWGTFKIEDEHLFPAKEWRLNGQANIANVPNWEELNAWEINEKLNHFWSNYGNVTVTNEELTELVDLIENILYQAYVDGMRPEDWPCDIIEAHVAMIYSRRPQDEHIDQLPAIPSPFKEDTK